MRRCNENSLIYYRNGYWRWKTRISLSFIEKLNQNGYTTAALKPIASGCKQDKNEAWVNEDALALRDAVTEKQPYAKINPFSFKDPIAPHLAAKRENKTLSIECVSQVIKDTLQHQTADVLIIEGAGGWALPLNSEELYSEVISNLQIPVILVIGIRLGCLNHGILTSQNILSSGALYLGWIANCIDPHMQAQDETIEALKTLIQAPYLGTMHYEKKTLAS
ncbi:MAG: dethiobiotin synthase [Legionellaceae bacterium]